MPPLPRNRLAQAAYWLLPSLLCAWLHRDGLHAWFQADDFAWLGANTEYNDAKTFWSALFQPAAQGTLRPLSERLFFFAFWHAFGWNALPYRLFILLNQCVNLLLVTFLARRLSGSAVAGFLAPILWIANAAVVVPMAWTSGYNEVLCATFLLSALALLVYGAGRKRFLYWQLAIFVAGFGALELNIVYPAIAAAYALFYNRRLLPWTVPMFVISAAYYKLHAALVPLQVSGPYKPHFDLAIVSTLIDYWKLLFVPPYGFITVQPVLAAAVPLGASLGIALFLLAELRARRYAAPFFACWFLLTLAPLLPFRDHLTHYYLFIPSMGIATVGAVAFARWRVAGAIAIALYLAVQVPLLATGERWYLDRSRAARNLVMGVKQVHEWEPEKAILLADVSKELYGFTIADSPFRLIPNARVYLAPEAEREISGLAPNLSPVAAFTLPAGPARRALLDGQLTVYSAARFPLQEITGSYTERSLAGAEPEDPRRVDAGSPFMAYLLGPEWYPLEGSYRWTAQRATLRIGGARKPAEKLFVSGLALPEALRSPLAFTITVDGIFAGTAALGPGDTTFVRAFALPASLINKPSLTIALEVGRTLQPEGRGRPLGLVFGTFEIR